MKIFVTGITGFIGRRMMEQFLPEDEIFILTRTDPGTLPGNFTVIHGDLGSPDVLFSRLTGIRPDVCIHLAWGGIPDYGFEPSVINLEQGSRLLRHLVEKCSCRKIIVTGSCWEYNRSFGPCREDETSSAGNYFVWAKRALCDLGMALAASHGITFVWARLFYVYGPGQRPGSLIPSIVQALRKGEMPSIQTPYNANDFIYVDDVAEALALMAGTEISSGIYNLGSGATVPVWKVCEIIETTLGREPVSSRFLKTMEKPATSDFWADMNRTKKTLNWHARTSLENGIKQYLSTSGVNL